MNNKLTIHGCGGAGIKITNNLRQALSELGEGFADLSYSFYDTTVSDIQDYRDLSDEKEFFKIDNTNHDGAEVSGSGGTRSTNAKHIIQGIRESLDEQKLQKKVAGEFHVVVFSGSGGSGSTIGPVLIKGLLESEIPVTAIVIGDTGSLLYSRNTKKTLESLYGVCKKLNKPLPISYINNSDVGSSLVKEQEALTDNRVFNYLSTLALFISNTNKSLDTQDMVTYLKPDEYTDFKLPSGLYKTDIYKDNTVIPEGARPVAARTLTAVNQAPDINLEGLLHHKYGVVLDTATIQTMNKQLPLHIVLFAGYFKNENARLAKAIEDGTRILETVCNDEMGDDFSDDGMAF